MKNKYIYILILFSFTIFCNPAFSKYPKGIKLQDLSISKENKDSDDRIIIKDTGRRPQSINTDIDEEKQQKIKGQNLCCFLWVS